MRHGSLFQIDIHSSAVGFSLIHLLTMLSIEEHQNNEELEELCNKMESLKAYNVMVDDNNSPVVSKHG